MGQQAKLSKKRRADSKHKEIVGTKIVGTRDLARDLLEVQRGRRSMVEYEVRGDGEEKRQNAITMGIQGFKMHADCRRSMRLCGVHAAFPRRSLRLHCALTAIWLLSDRRRSALGTSP